MLAALRIRRPRGGGHGVMGNKGIIEAPTDRAARLLRAVEDDPDSLECEDIVRE